MIFVWCYCICEKSSFFTQYTADSHKHHATGCTRQVLIRPARVRDICMSRRKKKPTTYQGSSL